MDVIVRKYKHEIYAVYSKISKTIKRVYLRKKKIIILMTDINNFFRLIVGLKL